MPRNHSPINCRETVQRRLLIVSNLKSNATGFEISCGKTCGQITLILWKTLLLGSKQFLHKDGRAIGFSQLFHKFSTGKKQLQAFSDKHLILFSTVYTERSQKNNSTN